MITLENVPFKRGFQMLLKINNDFWGLRVVYRHHLSLIRLHTLLVMHADHPKIVGYPYLPYCSKCPVASEFDKTNKTLAWIALVFIVSENTSGRACFNCSKPCANRTWSYSALASPKDTSLVAYSISYTIKLLDLFTLIVRAL